MVYNYANAFTGGAARRSQRKKRGPRSARGTNRASAKSTSSSEFSSDSSDSIMGSTSLFDLISQRNGHNSGQPTPIKRSTKKPIAGDLMNASDLPGLLGNMMAMHDTTGAIKPPGNPAGLLGYATGLIGRQIMPAAGTIPLPPNVDDLLFGVHGVNGMNMGMMVDAADVEEHSTPAKKSTSASSTSVAPLAPGLSYKKETIVDTGVSVFEPKKFSSLEKKQAYENEIKTTITNIKNTYEENKNKLKNFKLLDTGNISEYNELYENINQFIIKYNDNSEFKEFLINLQQKIITKISEISSYSTKDEIVAHLSENVNIYKNDILKIKENFENAKQMYLQNLAVQSQLAHQNGMLKLNNTKEAQESSEEFINDQIKQSKKKLPTINDTIKELNDNGIRLGGNSNNRLDSLKREEMMILFNRLSNVLRRNYNPEISVKIEELLTHMNNSYNNNTLQDLSEYYRYAESIGA